MPTTVLTLKELADYLRCSPSSIYRMLTVDHEHDNDPDKPPPLPHWRIGSDYRFSQERIDGWLVEKEKWEKGRRQK